MASITIEEIRQIPELKDCPEDQLQEMLDSIIAFSLIVATAATQNLSAVENF